MILDIFIYWLFSAFFPPEKKRGTQRRSYSYDTTSLLIADGLIRNDKGSPKTYNDNFKNDPFLNEDYLDDGPNW